MNRWLTFRKIASFTTGLSLQLFVTGYLWRRTGFVIEPREIWRFAFLYLLIGLAEALLIRWHYEKRIGTIVFFWISAWISLTGCAVAEKKDFFLLVFLTCFGFGWCGYRECRTAMDKNRLIKIGRMIALSFLILAVLLLAGSFWMRIQWMFKISCLYWVLAATVFIYCRKK